MLYARTDLDIADAFDLNELIEKCSSMDYKNSILLFDCCFAGSFVLNEGNLIKIDETLSAHVGKGCAVMASATASQTSGFVDDERLSCYTGFLYDAMTCKILIRKGRKSLEDINELVFRFADIWNQKHPDNTQNPVFRSNITGTVYFDVEDYIPYKKELIYEETEDYIILDVQPNHNVSTKRYAIKVLLKKPFSFETIAGINREIVNKAKRYEVYDNPQTEARLSGKPTGIIWCYYGYDESDMTNNNYVCYTTWVDEYNNPEYWYKPNKYASFIEGVYFWVNPSYLVIKGLQRCTLGNEELIQKTRECTSNLVNIANQYIELFREFKNTTFPETVFVELVKPLNSECRRWYFIQSDLPVPPIELHQWAEAHTMLANTIIDLSLFYDKDNYDKWSADNKKWLLQNTISNYEKELEKLKRIDENPIIK